MLVCWKSGGYKGESEDERERVYKGSGKSTYKNQKWRQCRYVPNLGAYANPRKTKRDAFNDRAGELNLFMGKEQEDIKRWRGREKRGGRGRGERKQKTGSGVYTRRFPSLERL